MVNMVVAFGASDSTYFIAAEGRTHSKSLPEGMKTALAGKVSTPIEYVAIGDNGKYFIRGRDTTDKTKTITRFNAGSLADMDDKLKKNLTAGVCFGSGGAWTWYHKSGTTYTWTHRGLGTNQSAWVKRMKTEHGENFRLFVGAGGATVISFADGRISYYSCGDKLSNTLSAAIKKNLHIRFVGLSPTHRDWFFIQFSDGSITFHASSDIGQHIKEIAKDKNIRARTVETL